MILGLVLSSMLMKAQAFFVPFPKAGDKYWQKQVPVAMRPRMTGQPSQGAWGATVYLLRSVFALTLALIRPRRRQSRESA